MHERHPVSRREQELERERKILRAALEELAHSDYGGMTVEQVAARAGVNKTTVYRKWETKAELVRAALDSTAEMFAVGTTAGDLRADLLRIAYSIRDFIHSYEGQCLLRLRLLHHPEPELAKIAQDFSEQQHHEVTKLLQTAVARGEIASHVDIVILMDMLWGAMHTRVVMKSEDVDDHAIERMVDLMVKAAAPEVPRARAAKRKPVRRNARA